MDNKPKTAAKDFFLYLAITIGLYVSVISFLTLIFAIIDTVLPLVGEFNGGFESTVRSSVAALIIFFPAFFYITWLIFKDLKANPEKKDIWVRKWMIYLTLFVAGLTIAIDLVILIYRFLGAEDLTLRFFLKVFFVLASAIVIFVFYFYNLKRETFEYKKSMNIFLATVSAVVIATIAYGIMLMGSPALQRARALDEQRVNDLSGIQNRIVYSQWQSKGTVPDALDALRDPISGYVVPTDPETGAAYGYTKISTNSFKLCATFKTVFGTSTSDVALQSYPVMYPSIPANENWQHDIGNVCFTRMIDETLYPVNKNSVPTPQKI